MGARTARLRQLKTLAWAVPAALVVLLLIVLIAKWLREQSGVHDFLATFPGATPLPDGAPVGIPAWLGWQHFFNLFFIVLIIRSGWLVRTVQRPSAYWTRNNAGLIRTKGSPKKISFDLWLHLSLDVLWLVNGAVFVILLFVSGQWMRVVPTSWEIVPNALSAALQYASLNWPTDNSWANYNSLQVLAYFATIFIAAPLAAITGVRMSGAWPANAKINRTYPIELARAVHFPVMLYFVLFIVVHVTLVLATDALRHLNFMFAARDDDSWTGFIYFGISLVVIVAAWIACRPIVLRSIAQLTGKVSR